MNAYILQPKNYIASSYFISRAFIKPFILKVFNAVQEQTSEIIELYNTFECYFSIFYSPVYFREEECILVSNRSPPVIIYQEA